MLYIHPPLSIAGYAFIFLFTILLFLKKNRAINIAGIAAWGLTFAGLATGMLWAQLAWGSYWSWDPKENMTLVLFIATTTSLLAHFEHHPKVAKWLALISSALVIVTALTSFILTGLHSFLH